MTARSRRRLAGPALAIALALGLTALFGRATAATAPGRQGLTGAQTVTPGPTGDDTVVALVGSRAVTEADLLQREAAVRDDLAYMQGQIDANSPAAAFLRSFTGLIDRSGVANVALGGLIWQAALFQYAVAGGFLPTDRQVALGVAAARAHAAQGKDPTLAAEAVAAGPGYWTTTYPRLVRQSLAVDNLRVAAARGQVRGVGLGESWDALSWQVVRQARVTVLRPSLI
ncbi:MAG TPA: hypothetical protein VFN57_10015, partial [Thermomicrobiaceae bacterium]|nr:hypothetical protein [Thermomicrobiaceae bacterium]